MEKRLLTIFLTVLLAVALSTVAFTAEDTTTYETWAAAATAAVESTDYTESGTTYTIKTALGMAWFADQVNNKSNNFSGKTVQLDADIDLLDAGVVGYDEETIMANGYSGGNSWTAIGSSTTIYFGGNFDGQDHTVSHVYINNDQENVGLFGYVMGSGSYASLYSIKNLGVIDSSITTDNSTGRAGGLVANLNTYTLKNCYSTATVSGYRAGSLVGSSSSYSRIQNCYATGDVTGSLQTGGLVGNVSSSTITDCYASGTVTGSGDYTGGLTGFVSGNTTITDCYAIGTVAGSGIYKGGFSGYVDSSYSSLTNCYYNSETSDCTAGVGSGTDNTTALTTAEMTGTEAETTMSLDDSVWTSTAYTLDRDSMTVTAPYPVLASNPQSPAPADSFAIPTWADAAGFAEVGTDYTESDTTYTIKTALGMAWFADQVNNQKNYFNGDTVELANDIDLLDAKVEGYDAETIMADGYEGGNSWPAIGTSTSVNFQGTFNGNNHTVSGVYINSSEQYQGLFGYVKGTSGSTDYSIKNVGVIDSSITSTHSSGYAGGLVAYSSSYTLENCYSTATVSGIRAGSLVGYITSSSAIKYCYATGDVTGSSHAGGLVGSVYTSSTVENCYATGTVRSNSDSNVGGLVGYVSGSTITNCYATGDASNGIAGSEAAGGLAGQASSSTITNCYAIGKASCDDKDGILGGLIGLSISNTVTNCYFNSDIMDTSGGLTTLEMTGLATDNSMELAADVWTYTAYTLNEDGTVTAPYPVLVSNQQSPAPSATFDNVLNWEMAAKCAKAGEDYTQDENGTYTISTAQGMAWFADQVNNKSNKFSGCTVELTNHIDLLDAMVVGYNEATIMANGYSGGNGWPAIGYSESYAFRGNFDGKGYTVSHVYANCAQSHHGLFGYVLGGNGQSIKNVGIIDSSITNRYSSGNTGSLVGCLDGYTLENCYSTATVSGGWAGGLVGFSGSGSIIKNCYAIGAVSGATVSGGLVGYISENVTITNCYYNSETSNCTIGAGGDGTDTTTALTTEEMTGLATDNSMELGNGWFFTADATGETSVTYYYPVLTNDAPDLVPSSTKSFAAISVSLAGWTYNATPSTPSVAVGSTGDISYTYSDSVDGTYTDVQPTDVGTYYIKATVASTATYAQTTSEAVAFTIALAGSTTTPSVDEEDFTYTYGDTITLTAEVGVAAATNSGLMSIATANTVSFYVEETDELLGTATVVDASGAETTGAGTATFEYDTSDKLLSIGDNTIKAYYGGSVNLNSSDSETITVTLEAKAVTAEVTDTITMTYDGTDTLSEVALNIPSSELVETGDVVTLTATATYDSVNVADGIGVVLSDMSKSGSEDTYYIVSLPENVTGNITQATHDNEIATGSAKYGKEGSVSLSAWTDLVGVNFTIDAVTSGSDYLVADSYKIEDDTLVFTFVDDADNVDKTATIDITVSSTNYENFTITATLTVTKQEVPVLSVENISQTYNGTAVLASAIVGTATVDGEDITGTWAFVNDAPTNVSENGTFTVVFTPDNAEDYTTATADISVTITPYAITLSVDDVSAYKNYSEPAYTYTQTGDLFDGDDWTSEPLIDSSEVDMNTNGIYTLTISADAGENYTITTEDGTLTVTTKSSSSGSTTTTTTTTTTTDTTTNDDGSVTATATTSATTSGSTAAATVSDSNMETAIENAVEAADGETANVEIAITTKDSTDTVSATISPDAMTAIAESDVDALVVTSDLGTVEIPSDALESIAGQATGTTVTITLELVDSSVLTQTQQTAVGDAQVYDLHIISDGEKITEFGGAEVTVTLPYELAEAESAEHIVIWYLADDGTMEALEGTYDEESGFATFSTPHFSYYAALHHNNPFDDMSVEDYYFSPVMWAVENGITNGTSDTTFSPDVTCTRAQAVTLLWKAYGSPVVGYINPFTDVSSDAYYYEAVLWAVSEGITSGASDSTFSPNVDCTRGQIVTFLYRAVGEPEISTDSTFTDVDNDSYCYNAVQWAVSEGITNGTTDTTFSPNSLCNRGQIVTFLYRNLAE